MYKSHNDYSAQLRRVEYYDEEQDRYFVFLTNAMDITALEVALLYKNRWSVELFFKWVKQHLKIKKFWKSRSQTPHLSKTSSTNLTSVLTKNLTGSMNPRCLIWTKGYHFFVV